MIAAVTRARVRPEGLVILAGPLGSGKTTVATALATGQSFEVLSVRSLLASTAAGPHPSRQQLEDLGMQIEAETAGSWIADSLRTRRGRWVVDSARTRRQVAHLRALPTVSILIYLTASARVRRERYECRIDSVPGGFDAGRGWNDASVADAERAVLLLRDLADLVCDTSQTSIEQASSLVLDTVLARFG
jgi:hypothetical protein